MHVGGCSCLLSLSLSLSLFLPPEHDVVHDMSVPSAIYNIFPEGQGWLPRSPEQQIGRPCRPDPRVTSQPLDALASHTGICSPFRPASDQPQGSDCRRPRAACRALGLPDLTGAFDLSNHHGGAVLQPVPCNGAQTFQWRHLSQALAQPATQASPLLLHSPLDPPAKETVGWAVPVGHPSSGPPPGQTYHFPKHTPFQCPKGSPRPAL